MLKKIYKAVANPIIGPILVASFFLILLVVTYMPKLSIENQHHKITHEAKEMITHLKDFRAYYTENVVKKVKAHSTLDINFDHESEEKTIPLPATTVHNLSKILADSNNIGVNFYSNYPFPNRSDRVLDSFQKESIKFLEANPDKTFTKDEILNGKKVYRVATADIFTSQACVDCHNYRADSPKTDWKLHDVRGVFEVIMPIDDNFVLTEKQMENILIFILIVVFLFIIHYGILYFKKERDSAKEAQILEDEIAKRTKDLQESNQLLLEYKKAVDASAIVSKSDLKGRITYVNDAFCEVSGYSKDQLIGKPHSVVRSADIDSSFYEKLWTTIKSKEIFKGIIKNRSRDGSFYYVAATIIPILDQNGEILEYLSLRYDITELVDIKNRAVRAEKAKSTFLANMSHEIRTPLNAIIGFSDILCESSSLAKDDQEHARIISRSAKSLLSIINDVLDISKIESGKLDLANESFSLNSFTEHIVELFSVNAKDKHIRFLFNADKNLPSFVIADPTRLQQVLSNLLSNAIKFTPEGGKVFFNIELLNSSHDNAKIRFTVIDSGIGMSEDQQRIVFEPFSQADDGISRKYGGTGLGLAICADIIELMGSKIELTSSLGEGSEFSFILELKVDNSKTESNIKKSDLVFALCSSDDDIENLKSNVKNYLDKIGAVYDLNDDCDRKADMLFCFGGDELAENLSMFKEVNTQSKIIYVGDQKNIHNNSTREFINYYIDLPIYGSKIFNIIAENSKINERVISSASSVNKTIDANILVAEDNPNNQKLIEILLHKIGVKHTIVNDGLEAIDAYKNGKFDMVLIDVNMPNLDGVSATKELLRLQREENLYKAYIIALTANSISGDREKYIDGGMDDYLSKPIEFEKLVNMIDKYVNKKVDENSTHESSSVLIVKEKKSSEEKVQFAPFNKSDAMKQLGLDEMTVDMLIDNFFLTLDDDLVKLQGAIDSKDCDAIYKAAHYIKGSCANLAMNSVANLLLEIENSAKNGNHKADITMIKSLLKEIKNGL